MIFKDVDLSDRSAIEAITKQFPPYSVFPFSDLIIWSTKTAPTQYMMFNNNLVIKITDFLNNRDFLYAFMGKHKVDKSIKFLLTKVNKLDLLPEETINNISNLEMYKITKQLDYIDYVLSLEGMCAISGRKNKDKRKYINRYENNKDIHIKQIDIGQDSIQKEILTLLNLWQRQKHVPASEFEREKAAIMNAFNYYKHLKYINIGIYHKNELIGFTINEVIRKDWIMGFFGKANVEYPGLNLYMEYETAKILRNSGFRYINLQQDLGIENLRNYKQGLHPVLYLNMYSIELRK